MKDEIKEKIKAYYVANDIDEVLDYITNLQEKNMKKEDRIFQLVWDLLDEQDIQTWKKIDYIELANFWVNMIEESVKNNPFYSYIELERLRERKLRDYLFKSDVKN